MRLIQIKFISSTSHKGEGCLCYHLKIYGKKKLISTDYKLNANEWNQQQQSIIFGKCLSRERLVYLVSLQKKIEEDLALFRNLINSELCSKSTKEHVFFNQFCGNLIYSLKSNGKIRTAETYETAINSFKRFLGEIEDISLSSINQNLMSKYEMYLLNNGICLNSVSFYMRNLRAIYNRAVEQGLTVQNLPFKYVYTGISKTKKRAISLEFFRKIKNFDSKSDYNMEFAKDIFMFSFYTRGMSFVDIAFLKKENLQNGILSYKRRKTGQQLCIKWEKQMQEIIDKYDNSNNLYLLPIIQRPDKNNWTQYKSAEHLVNNKLKIIGKELGLRSPLTTYVARHSWASIARSKNIPISVISEAMGHDSEATTRIYLATMDTSAVDNANKLILKLL